MTTLPDSALVIRARAGDREALASLWARHEGRVLHICRSFARGEGRDPAIDEHDLASEVFVRAVLHLDRYEDRAGAGGFGAWLARIAQRVGLRYAERCRLRLDAGRAASEAPPADACSTVCRQAVDNAVVRAAAAHVWALPPAYRDPFRMLLEQYSQAEIAAKLGLAADTVRKRVQRARRMLRPAIAGLLEHNSASASGDGRPTAAAARAVESALSRIVADHRIVTVTLPSGGEMHLCLRVPRRSAGPSGSATAATPGAKRWRDLLALAEMHYEAGRWDAAEPAFRQAHEARPGEPQAALRLSQLLRARGERGEAAAVLRRAHELVAPAHRAHLEAEALATEGRHAEAVDAFERALLSDPRCADLYVGLDRALAALSRYDAQLANLARMRARLPGDPRGCTLAYTPCARLERFDVALPLMQRAVRLDPNDPVGLKALFQVRMNLRLFDDATRQTAERLVAAAPDYAASWAELSWFYAETGRCEDSIAVMRRFLRLHPRNAEANAVLAWRLSWTDDIAAARRRARRAYALDPQHWYVCWTLLVLAPDARVAMEIARRFPDDAHMVHVVASALRRCGGAHEALPVAQRARELAPHVPPIRGEMAQVLAALGRHGEAAEETAAALAASPTRRIPLLLAHARALRMAGLPGADAVLQEAADRAEQEDDDLGRAEVLEARGLPAEAASAYARELARDGCTMVRRRKATMALRSLGEPATQG